MKVFLYIIKLIILYYIQSLVILFLIWDNKPYSILYIALLIFTVPFFCEYILIPKLDKKLEGNNNDT